MVNVTDDVMRMRDPCLWGSSVSVRQHKQGMAESTDGAMCPFVRLKESSERRISSFDKNK